MKHLRTFENFNEQEVYACIQDLLDKYDFSKIENRDSVSFHSGDEFADVYEPNDGLSLNELVIDLGSAIKKMKSANVVFDIKLTIQGKYAPGEYDVNIRYEDLFYQYDTIASFESEVSKARENLYGVIFGDHYAETGNNASIRDKVKYTATNTRITLYK